MGFEQYKDRAFITIHSDGPRGPKGDKGDRGEKGDPGEVTQEEFDDLKDQVALDKLDYVELKGVNDGVVTPNKTSFMTISSNLIDETSFKLGFNFNSSTGEPFESELYALSDFIPVEPNSTIIFDLGVLKIGRFDENKNFISIGGVGNTPVGTYSAHYVRVVVYKEVLGKGMLQLNKGEILLPYEPYYTKLSGISIDREQVIGLDTHTPEENKSLWEVDRYIISNETTELFTSSSIPSTGRNFHTMDTFLELYDDLMARFPHYITKTTLGQDSLGNNLYRYDFRPQEVPDVMVGNIKHKDKTPKMILISGIHGMERAGAYNLFESLRQITEDWQENGVLEMLRWNTHFIVIPIANPYGFENLVRQNENGVDLARNFPAEWEKNNAEIGDNTYQGPEPLSEKSSQIIASLIANNKDAIYFGSFHNYGGNNPNFIWNGGATKMQVDMGKMIVSMLSRKWKKTYEWLPQDETTYFGYSNSFAPSGSEGVYAAHLGIQASTFETSDNMFYEVQGEPYSALSLTLGAETIVNWLALNLRENVKYYNSI